MNVWWHSEREEGDNGATEAYGRAGIYEQR